MSNLVIPKIEPVFLTCSKPRLSDYGRELFEEETDLLPAARFIQSLTNASWSDYAEGKILEHFMPKASYTFLSTLWVALCTVTPTDASTGVSITEAGYTGYARKSFTATALGAATGTSPTEIKNSGEALTFAECTASSSTIIGFCVVDKSVKSEGNSIGWGTVTSMVISTSATPASIATNSLVATQD